MMMYLGPRLCDVRNDDKNPIRLHIPVPGIVDDIMEYADMFYYTCRSGKEVCGWNFTKAGQRAIAEWMRDPELLTAPPAELLFFCKTPKDPVGFLFVQQMLPEQHEVFVWHHRVDVSNKHILVINDNKLIAYLPPAENVRVLRRDRVFVADYEKTIRLVHVSNREMTHEDTNH